MTDSTTDALTYGNNFDDYTTKDIVLYMAKVLFDYEAQDTDELSLIKGTLPKSCSLDV